MYSYVRKNKKRVGVSLDFGLVSRTRTRTRMDGGSWNVPGMVVFGGGRTVANIEGLILFD